MAQPAPPNPSQTASPDLTTLLSTWAGNFQRNTSSAFAELRLKDYIRLVVIIGGYCLLRPWLMKLGAKMQTKSHEADSADTGLMNPNELRGKVEIPGVDEDSDEEEEGEGTAGNWGRNARVRQRKFIREALEKEEQRLRDETEAESDKEIEEFLIKE
jgi:Protein trafficking PGA2